MNKEEVIKEIIKHKTKSKLKNCTGNSEDRWLH